MYGYLFCCFSSPLLLQRAGKKPDEKLDGLYVPCMCHGLIISILKEHLFPGITHRAQNIKSSLHDIQLIIFVCFLSSSFLAN